MHSAIINLQKTLACHGALYGIINLFPRDTDPTEVILSNAEAREEGHDLLVGDIYRIDDVYSLRVFITIDGPNKRTNNNLKYSVKYAIYRHAVAVISFNFDEPSFDVCSVIIDRGRVLRHLPQKVQSLFVGNNDELVLNTSQSEALLQQIVQSLIDRSQ